MNPIIYLLTTIISLINLLLIVYIVISLLISFNILNRNQPLVAKIYYALGRLLEPMLEPIRKLLPDLNGIDISPIFLIIALNFLEYALVYYFA